MTTTYRSIMKQVFVCLGALLVLAAPATAQEQAPAATAATEPQAKEAQADSAPATTTDTAQATAPAVADSGFAQRLELAKKMNELNPAAKQIDSAIESVAARVSDVDREAFKSGMRNLLNYRALEQISINAMAETYTLEELKAMVDYYSKPEGKSAAAKVSQYQAKVQPEITRMLDRAIMNMKTGGEN